MQREIKFRGKRIDNGEWEYGHYVVLREGHTIVNTDGAGLYFYNQVDPATVGQFTGLKDKNGKEIYEGDIVRYTFDNPDSVLATENGLKVRTDKIFWQEWRASFAIGCELTNNDLFRYVRNGNRVEVIGNIHDNPELLEVKE